MRFVLVCVYSFAALLLVGCTSVSKVMVSAHNEKMRQAVESSRSRLSDPDVDQYLRDLCREVLGSARRLDGVDRPGHQRDELLDIYDRFDVYVVNDVKPNAFVVGDDYTILNTALLAQAESAEELVMVIGHEFGHLRRGHQIEKMTDMQYGLAAGLVAQTVAEAQNSHLAPGDRARASEEAAASMMAVFMPQRPEREHESDATGVDVMSELGLDLKYADDFFVRMLQKYGDPSGTHPKPSERIAMIRSQVSELESRGYRPTRTLDAERFLAMRQRVRDLVRRAVEDGTIVYFSEEVLKASQQESLVHPLGCGPLYADPSVASREFLRSIGTQ